MPLNHILIAVALLVSGCASITHVPVTDDSKADGFRYYRASPYLLIYHDQSNVAIAKLLYLPDQTTKMSAKPAEFWSSLDTSLKFSNGVLVEETDTADSTVVPKAIISALEKVLPAILSMAAPPPGAPPSPPAPRIYKIMLEPDGRVFLIGKPGDPIIKTN
jgi:uncharacterized protein YceK